jgi:Sulfotransferase family
MMDSEVIGCVRRRKYGTPHRRGISKRSRILNALVDFELSPCPPFARCRNDPYTYPMAATSRRSKMWKPASGTEFAAFVARTTVHGVRYRRSFQEVECFCLLIGYPHSGSTLVSSVLNAHPEMVIGHETDILRYVRPGLSRNFLFSVILDRDRQFTAQNRRWNGNDYDIPASGQGSFSRLRVIGDKCIARQAMRLHQDPRLLDRLRSTLDMPLRVIHLVRNPFDNIASIHGVFSSRIEKYRALGEGIDEIQSRLRAEELCEIRYEDVVADPSRSLSDVCHFLGLEASEEYLQGCAQLIRPSIQLSRFNVDWTESQRSEVEAMIAKRSVLTDYTFGSKDR